jgi:hypothetical protein
MVLVSRCGYHRSLALSALSAPETMPKQQLTISISLEPQTPPMYRHFAILQLLGLQSVESLNF